VKQAQLNYNRGEATSAVQTVRRGKKVGRNEPCPCGSGKKFKKCCGVNA
jgi:preprotein translocase subunit SecA